MEPCALLLHTIMLQKMINYREKPHFLSGNEALAYGAYENGLRFASSYPGTPATEILEFLAQFSEVEAQWAVNEKVAFEASLSASIAGVRSLFSAKHVGLNVAMDPLMTSAYTGVGAGFLVVSCDDPGIHSSQNEQDNRFIARFAQIPLLEPASPFEARKFVPEAFKISERFDTPVMLRMTTRVSHTKENVPIGARKDIAPLSFKADPAKYVMVPRNAYARHIVLMSRLDKLKEYAEKTVLNRIEIKSRKLGIITSGVGYLYAREMYSDASFLKLGMSYPFCGDKVREFFSKVKEVHVVEELEPLMEDEVKKLGLRVKTRHPSFRLGELRPEYIPALLRGESKKEHPYTARKPLLCPGCPHRASFAVLRKRKAVVVGDIGCYTLGALPPLSSLHTCLCMGSGVSFMEGFGRFVGKNTVGVIGDSTFIHSGITGLISLRYNNSKGVIMILDNSTTAMTGNQPHPASGMTIKDEPSKKLVLEDICRACGADNVDVIDPHDFSGLDGLLERRLNEEALSVIICRYPCRLVERRKEKEPVYRKENCVKCGLCLSINCPAIERAEDGFIRINEGICTGCNLCLHFCKKGALSAHGG